MRSTCAGAHIEQSCRASARNFTKNKSPLPVFPKDHTNFTVTAFLRNTLQYLPLIIFVLSKYMYFILELASIFGMLFLTRLSIAYFVCTSALTYFCFPSFNEFFKHLRRFCRVNINRKRGSNFWSMRNKDFLCQIRNSLVEAQ